MMLLTTVCSVSLLKQNRFVEACYILRQVHKKIHGKHVRMTVSEISYRDNLRSFQIHVMFFLWMPLVVT